MRNTISVLGLVAAANAAGGATEAHFIEPILKEYSLIDSNTVDSESGYALQMWLGAIDNYKDPATRDMHLKLKLKAKRPPDGQYFYFGALFKPENESA
jgi:hypothetical protein